MDLLNPNYEKRISAQEALNHRWFQLFSKTKVMDICIPRPLSTPEGLNNILMSNKTTRSASSAGNKTHCCELSFVGLHSPLCPLNSNNKVSQNPYSTGSNQVEGLPESENNINCETSKDQLDSWKNLAKQLISKWKRFANQNQLKRAALRVIAQHLYDGDAELQPLRQLFFVLDSEKDGALSCDEVAAGIEAIQCATPYSLPKNVSHHTLNNVSVSSSSLPSPVSCDRNVDTAVVNSNENGATGNSLSMKDLEGLLSAVSLEKNNVLEYSDFIAASIDQKHYLRDDILKAAFSVFDRDGDGHIDFNEIRATLGWYGNCHTLEGSPEAPSISEQEIYDIISAWDHDKDGSINYKDFVTSLKTDDTSVTSN